MNLSARFSARVILVYIFLATRIPGPRPVNSSKMGLSMGMRSPISHV